MTGKLPPSASIATPVEGAKLHAPSAANNAQPLCDVLRDYAPAPGAALEIASGTGQHVVAFARAMPTLIWQPTEVDPVRQASVDAYVHEAGLGNLLTCATLDATEPGWHQDHSGKSLIVLVNLLHLISEEAARTVVAEAVAALAPQGLFVLYGPFKRDGALTSDGDRRFDAELRAADHSIGYKNDAAVMGWLTSAGAADVATREMPANNLALIARKA